MRSVPLWVSDKRPERSNWQRQRAAARCKTFRQWLSKGKRTSGITFHLNACCWDAVTVMLRGLCKSSSCLLCVTSLRSLTENEGPLPQREWGHSSVCISLCLRSVLIGSVCGMWYLFYCNRTKFPRGGGGCMVKAEVGQEIFYLMLIFTVTKLGL